MGDDERLRELRARLDAQLAQLAESVAESRRIADTIPQLVWIASPDGRIEYSNERWLDYTGHTLTGDSSSDFFDAFVAEDRIRVRERWLRTVRVGSDFELEARIVSSEGHVRWFLLRAVPMVGAGGVILRWAGTCTDIDAQKRAELSLAAARDVRDVAIATLGHELRTPLTTISVTLDLVRTRAPTAVRECATIERQVVRMSRMVEDLLDAARVSGGRVTLQRRPTDLSRAVADAIEACSAQLRDRAHMVVTHIDPHLVVDGEPDRLVQIFINLVANAAKFTPLRGHIDVRATQLDDTITVEVRDDGVGIAPELVGRLFEPFVQGAVSSQRSGGLGLGLAITKALVELHGGTIEVQSCGLQRGSTFIVRLPACVHAVTDALAVSKRRVLIVEDSPDVSEMLVVLLRLDGHEPIVAHDARSAIELARTSKPDLALIDIRLPDMDGESLARELRGTLGDQCPSLVAMSGLDRPPSELTSAPVFDRWVTKPFDLQLLRSVIASPRRRRRRRASSRLKKGPH